MIKIKALHLSNKIINTWMTIKKISDAKHLNKDDFYKSMVLKTFFKDKN